jgi:hypothetical protein
MPSEQPERRTLYIVTLQPQRGVDGVRALRSTLKTALRRFGLKAISAYESTPQDEKLPAVTGAGGRSKMRILF